MASAEFNGDTVHIRNLRNSDHRKGDILWEERDYDLTRIRSVDFVVEPFSSWRGLAHTFLTFGFEDNRYVAISIEIRKEVGESREAVCGEVA